MSASRLMGSSTNDACNHKNHKGSVLESILTGWTCANCVFPLWCILQASSLGLREQQERRVAALMLGAFGKLGKGIGI